MATPNYSYEKRQRELAKKKKNEEKRLRKLNGKSDSASGNPDAAGDEGENLAPDASPDTSEPDPA